MKVSLDHVKDSALKISVFVYTALLSTVPVAAAPGSGASSAITNGVKSGISQVYSIISAIVLPIAVLALAICAAKLIVGTPKAADEAKSFAIKIVIALALVYLAPLIIGEVSSWFNSYSDTYGIMS